MPWDDQECIIKDNQFVENFKQGWHLNYSQLSSAIQHNSKQQRKCSPRLLSNTLAANYLSIWYMASVAKELNFSSCLILTYHAGLMDTALNSVSLEHFKC